MGHTFLIFVCFITFYWKLNHLYMQPHWTPHPSPHSYLQGPVVVCLVSWLDWLSVVYFPTVYNFWCHSPEGTAWVCAQSLWGSGVRQHPWLCLPELPAKVKLLAGLPPWFHSLLFPSTSCKLIFVCVCLTTSWGINTSTPQCDTIKVELLAWTECCPSLNLAPVLEGLS